MDAWAYLRFACMSVSIGLATFCISYAAWVWKRRKSSVAEPTASPAFRTLRRLCGVAFIGGLLGMLIVSAAQELIPRQGILRLDEALAVRSRRDAVLHTLVEEGAVRQGDLLAQFQSPAAESQIASLEAKLLRLQAQAAEIELKPLEIDPELTRRHQSLLNKMDQLSLGIYNLIPAWKTTERVGTEHRLERLDKTVALDADVVKYEMLIQQAETELDFKQLEFARSQKLVSSGAMSKSAIHDVQRDAEVAIAEVIKLQKAVQQFQKEQEQLRAGAEELDLLVNEQSTALGQEIARLTAELKRSREAAAVLEEKIAADVVRAKQQRTAEQQQVGLEMNEVRAELDGIRKSLAVVAPHDGQVIYRNPAPNSLDEHGVMLVVARGNGARVQFAVPNAAAALMNDSSTVQVYVEDSALAHRLWGKFAAIKPSPYEPDRQIAEFTCQLPPDLILTLANEESASIQLTWGQPVLTIPTFQGAAVATLAGALGWCLAGCGGWLFRPRRRRTQDVKPQETTVPQAAAIPRLRTAAGSPPASAVPAPAGARHWDAGRFQGTAGTMLEMLGHRMREELLQGELREETLASAEWAIDRHQVRGVNALRAGLLTDPEGSEAELQSLSDALTSLELEADLGDDLPQRMRRILTTLHVLEREGDSEWSEINSLAAAKRK